MMPRATRGAALTATVRRSRMTRRNVRGVRRAEVAASVAPDLAVFCGCCCFEEKMPRRRAVVKAIASVESSCSSLNSFSAAKVDASSTDHAAAGGRRRAKEAIQAESEQQAAVRRSSVTNPASWSLLPITLYKFSPSSGSSLFRSPKVRRKEQVCAGRRAERKERLSLQVIYPLTCPEVLRAYPHPPHAPMGGHQPAPTCTNLHPTRTRPARGPSSAHLPPIRLREGASVRLGGALWLWERSGAA